MEMNNLMVAGAAALILTWILSKVMGGASPEAKKRMKKVDGVEARKCVKAGAVLLDVRSPQEFGMGHVKGAINMPVQEIQSRLSEIGETDEVVVYCQSGGRSARAAQIVAESGRQVYDVGPMSAY